MEPIKIKTISSPGIERSGTPIEQNGQLVGRSVDIVTATTLTQSSPPPIPRRPSLPPARFPTVTPLPTSLVRCPTLSTLPSASPRPLPTPPTQEMISPPPPTSPRQSRPTDQNSDFQRFRAQSSPQRVLREHSPVSSSSFVPSSSVASHLPSSPCSSSSSSSDTTHNPFDRAIEEFCDSAEAHFTNTHALFVALDSLITQWKALFRNHSPELSAGSRLRDNIDRARCFDGKVLNRLQQAKAGGADRVLTATRDIYTEPEYTKYLQVVAEIIADSEKLAPLLEKNKDTIWRKIVARTLEKYESLIPVIVGATNLSSFHFQRAMRIPMLLEAMEKLAPGEHKENIKILFLSIKTLTMQMESRQDFLVKYRDRLIYFSNKKPNSKLNESEKQEIADLWKILNEFKDQGFNIDDLKGVNTVTLSQLYQGTQSATSESTGQSPLSRELMKELMQSPVMRRRNSDEA